MFYSDKLGLIMKKTLIIIGICVLVIFTNVLPAININTGQNKKIFF
jgi:hypothetical protein